MAAKTKYSGPLEKGREICCYTIEEPLGSGGMGEVWVARHRMLNRPAAVKMIRPEALGPDQSSRQRAVRRFVREARATSAVVDGKRSDYPILAHQGCDKNLLCRNFGDPLPDRPFQFQEFVHR